MLGFRHVMHQINVCNLLLSELFFVRGWGGGEGVGSYTIKLPKPNFVTAFVKVIIGLVIIDI